MLTFSQLLPYYIYCRKEVIKIEYGEKIKQARNNFGMSQKELAERLGLKNSTISKWEHCETMPSIQQVTRMAEIFDKPVNYFFSDSWIEIEPVEDSDMAYIPVLGNIACGDPIMTTENIEYYEPVPKSLLPSGQLVYLIAEGNSMSPTIEDGDLVMVRIQAEVEDNSISAVLLENGETATLKRIKHQGEIIMLIPDNKKYDPIILTPDSKAKVFGKVVQSTRKF